MAKKRPATDAPTEKAASRAAHKHHSSLRETVESIVIAFVLAFLFRTFEAEAFVIPTGSMAPTLMGQHEDVFCPQCDYQYQVNASDDASDAPRSALDRAGLKVARGTCPICRHEMEIPHGPGDASFKGDRIIVAKFPYEFHDPLRWDVAVFKYPAEAQTNYIKRIIGLPNETLRVHRGDIATQPVDQSGFSIARKPPEKLLAMAQIVHDSDHEVDKLLAAGWPARWQPGEWTLDDGALVFRDAALPGGWTAAEAGRVFETDGSAADEVWLRYQHVLPDRAVWNAVERGGALPPGAVPRPRLISDYYAYNSAVNVNELRRYGGRAGQGGGPASGVHWVGDLLLECEVEVSSDAGELVLELVEGSTLVDGRREPCRFQCRIDLATGQARLAIVGRRAEYAPTAETSVRGAGTYQLRFANFDDQLLLWVNDSVVAFDQPTVYEPLDNTRPTPADLAPAGVASRGAAMRVKHLRVKRDLYYIAVKFFSGNRSEGLMDYERNPYLGAAPTARDLAVFFSSPTQWDVFDEMEELEFRLGPDQFFALGDNSPASKDGRLWGAEYWVNRELLIGEALFIYWPHSWNRVPGTEIPFPMFPNFSEMEFVR